MFKILLLVSTRNSLGEEYRAQWPFFMFSGGASDQLAGYSIATEGLEEGAYNTNQKVPSSCDCWETGRAWHYSKCDIFECTCICDLTAGACDHNCCCDRECSDFQRERFDAIQASCQKDLNIKRPPSATQERMWIESTPNFLCQFKVRLRDL